MRAKAWLLAATVMICAAAGCLEDYCVYTLELAPEGKSMERKLTASRAGRDASEFTQEALAELEKRYGRRLPQTTSRAYSFVGRFAGTMPGDFGGSSSYTHLGTPMGEAGLYLERFNGNDELGTSLEETLRAADTLATLADGWLTTELKRQQGFDKLHRFLSQDFRSDLKNTSAYCWLNGRLSMLGFEELCLRVGQYLFERGYFRQEDLPAIARGAMETSDDPSCARLMSLAQRLVAAKMGVGPGEPVPASLGFLSSTQPALRSLRAYLQTTREFKDWLKERGEDQAPATRPDDRTLEMIGSLAGKAFPFDVGLHLFATKGDEVRLSLALSTAPAMTNGQWDQQSRQVIWATFPASMPAGLPTICYAAWMQPDEKFQHEHFGKTVLSDKDLAAYCLWRKGLTEKEGRQWDEFVAGLKPDKSLQDRLRAFTQPAGRNAPARLTVETILRQLEQGPDDAE